MDDDATGAADESNDWSDDSSDDIAEREDTGMGITTFVASERLHTALAEFVQVEIDGDGDAYVDHEGVRAYLHVGEYGEESRTTVQVFAISGLDFPPSPALFRWAATAAARFRFGTLSAEVNDKGRARINFSHTFFVDGLDDEALRATVLPVIYTAAELRRETTQLFTE